MPADAQPDGRPSKTHPCPGKCGRRVRRTAIACRWCWRQLPPELQDPIIRSRRTDPDALDAAVNAARGWYRTHPVAPADTQAAGLTLRERDVVELIAEGKTEKEIGEALRIEPSTVYTHAKSAMRKLAARNRAHLVARAYQTGVLTLDPRPALDCAESEPAGDTHG